VRLRERGKSGARQSSFARGDGRGRQSPQEQLLLDEAGADAAEEIFAVGFGLGQNFGLIAVFEGYFLQEKFNGIFGFEALRHQLADARGEAVGVVGGTEAREVIGAFMLAKFTRCQAVERGLGLGITEQRGDWGVPFAMGAGPSMERVVGGPD
jgi:hypothetical protein